MSNNKNDNQEVFSKVSINWYPGHMAKTRKQIIQDLKLIDIVIELLDARIPISSQNPNIAEITKNKKKIIVLNKCDLADENQNRKWVEYFESKNIPVVLVDSNSGKGIENFIKKVEKIMQVDLEMHSEKGRVGRKIRAMILGIPNVGKSSFINRISKRTSAGVGNRPGVTRQKQWIRINEKIELLDTPGVLWPKFESEEVALNLCFTGTIKEEILDKIEIAYQLTKFLLENYRNKLCERYKLKEEYINETLEKERPENENIYEIFLQIGKNRGCIMSGGRIDEEKTARILLDEFKNGKLGKITIERPIK
ncbi:MAG: ribosome biogenesis GTPase YlqF [Clostridia bacterium]|nr:ribosome biogenesis GTPase YlqF [Clostridia bacterium]